MRIALVYRSFHLGGSLPRFNVELARYLNSRGHEVHVYSNPLMTERALASECTFHDVPVSAVADSIAFSSRELRSFARNAAAMLREASYDVVHTRAPSTWVADVLHVPGVQRGEAELGGYSTARWAATLLRNSGDRARHAVERKAIRNPRVVRFHTDAPIVCDHLVRFYGVDREAIRSIPPGVNVDEFHPGDRLTARRAAGLPVDDRPLVLFCGHDFVRKGLDHAILATAASETGFELVVVGHSGDQERFETLALQAGVRNRVHFAGARSDSAVFFQACDALVLPSRADVWGVTVVEAMACGIPPVVSPEVGSSIVVEEGVDGYVLPRSFDAQVIAATLDRAIGDPDRRTLMVSRCRATGVRYSWEAHGRLVEQDLEEVVARRTSTGRSSLGNNVTQRRH